MYSWLGDHFPGSSEGLQMGSKGTPQMQEVTEKTGKDRTCSCGVKRQSGGCGEAGLMGGTEEIGKQVKRRYRSKAGEQRHRRREQSHRTDSTSRVYRPTHLTYTDRTGGRSWQYQAMSSRFQSSPMG